MLVIAIIWSNWVKNKKQSCRLLYRRFCDVHGRHWGFSEWPVSAPAPVCVCLFVWFAGVTPAEPRCVIVLNMVLFSATQTPLNTRELRWGVVLSRYPDHILHVSSPEILKRPQLSPCAYSAASNTQGKSCWEINQRPESKINDMCKVLRQAISVNILYPWSFAYCFLTVGESSAVWNLLTLIQYFVAIVKESCY